MTETEVQLYVNKHYYPSKLPNLHKKFVKRKKKKNSSQEQKRYLNRFSATQTINKTKNKYLRPDKF